MKTPFIGLKNLVKQKVAELKSTSPPYLLEKDFESNIPTLAQLQNNDTEWEIYD